MEFLDTVFGTKDHVDGLQQCARALVIFPYGLLMVRLVGRRIFGTWSAIDFVVAIVIGSALGRSMTGSAPLGATLLSCTLLMALHWVLMHLAARHRMFSRLVEGGAIVLAQGGRLVHSRMLRNNITNADLVEALREQGINDISETSSVVLEPSGKITVTPAK